VNVIVRRSFIRAFLARDYMLLAVRLSVTQVDDGSVKNGWS